jgi:hypothetical protein
MQTDEAGNTPATASRFIDNAYQLISVGFYSDKRPTTGQIAPSCHAFALSHIFDGFIVTLQIVSQVLLPSPRLLVSPQVNSVFLPLLRAMVLSTFVSH